MSECECWVTPEDTWTVHYGAVEPGSQMEPNPDCPVHPAAAVAVIAQDRPTPWRPTREQADAALGWADRHGGFPMTLAAEVRALRAAVLALHKPEEHPRPKGRSFTVCAHCTSGGDPYTAVSTDWPCPTVAALGGES